MLCFHSAVLLMERCAAMPGCSEQVSFSLNRNISAVLEKQNYYYVEFYSFFSYKYKITESTLKITSCIANGMPFLL